MRLRRAIPFAGAFLLYALIAVVMLLPLLRQPSSVLPADVRDPLLDSWILWWDAHHLPLTSSWWNAPTFFPTEGVLAFSEHLLGLSLLTTPLQWLGGSPVLAYNIVLVLSFPLAALAAHGLVFSLTSRHDAGIVGGLAFGFNPYRVAQLAHLQVLSSYWMPVVFLGLHAYDRTRRKRALVLAAAAWAMQGLVNGYFLLFVPVLVGLWVLWFLPPWSDWRSGGAVAIAWTAGAIVLSPLALGYVRLHNTLGLTRSFEEIAAAGAHPGSFLNMSALSVWHAFIVSSEAEKQLFPGLTGVVLVAVCLWQAAAGRAMALLGPWVRWRRAALLMSVGAALTLAAFARRPDVVAGVTLTGAGALLLTSSIVVEAHHRRSVLAFYSLAACAMLVLSLGPAPTLRGAPVWSWAPYRWLLLMPGYSSLRVPARFIMLVTLCMSTAAGVAFARLVGSASRVRRACLAGVCACVLAEGWISHVPVYAAPTPPGWAADVPPEAVVMEIPLGDEEDDARALFRGVYHQRPIVNGYSGYVPAYYPALTAALEDRDHAVLSGMASFAPLFIVLHRDADTAGVWARFLEEQADLRSLGTSGTDSIYWLAQGVLPEAPLPAEAVPVQSVVLEPGGDRLDVVLDGNLTTTWSTAGGQRGDEALRIDLGSPQAVGTVELSLGPRPDAFPRELRVLVSRDGSVWTETWRGRGARPTFFAGLQHPRETPIRLELGNRSARFVRVEQVAHHRQSWVVAELRVWAPSVREPAE